MQLDEVETAQILFLICENNDASQRLSQKMGKRL